MVWCWWDGPLGAERREAAGLMGNCVSAAPCSTSNAMTQGLPPWESAGAGGAQGDRSGSWEVGGGSGWNGR